MKWTLLLIFLVACADTISIDKNEAQSRAENGDKEDYCLRFGWYDDGQCDVFCEKPDPDCEETCQDYPTCPAGLHEVQQCQSSNCHEESVCGHQIFCEMESTDCLIDEPYCPDGQVWEARCPEGRQCGGGFHDNCGNSYVCVEPLCEETQVCPESLLVVEKCHFWDSNCLSIDGECGKVHCIQNTVCQVPASCKSGEQDHRTKQSCLDSGGPCRQTYACGEILWCSPKEGCAKEECSETEKEVNECTNIEQCRDLSSCGEDLLCEVL